MSAKQSLNETNLVLPEVANRQSPNDGKTPSRVAGNRVIDGNDYYLSGSTKSREAGRRKSSGRSESEDRGSLEKSIKEMDEKLFYNRSQHRLTEKRSGLAGISGVLVTTRTEREFRNLGSPRPTGKKPGGDFLYKETKMRKSGRVADEIVVPKMIVQDNAIGGKGLY